MYIRFYSYLNNGWTRLTQECLDQIHETKSLMEIWDDIWKGECAGVEKAFLMTDEHNVQGMYLRDF